MLVLSAARKEVEETGARLLVGDYNALAIARDKWKTFEFCQQNGLACAPSCLPDQMQDFIAVHGYPVVVKPREGYGSLHMYIANDGKKVEHAISAIISAGWQPMVQKYIPGELEFTSGVTVDRNARYVMSSISRAKKPFVRGDFNLFAENRVSKDNVRLVNSRNCSHRTRC